jgi:hypothetical protein
VLLLAKAAQHALYFAIQLADGGFPPEAQFSAHALEQFVVDRHTFFVADVADARMDLVL